MGGQDACEARKFISCGTGILPVLENGATYEFQADLAIITDHNNTFAANNYARILFARPADAAIKQRSR